MNLQKASEFQRKQLQMCDSKITDAERYDLRCFASKTLMDERKSRLLTI